MPMTLRLDDTTEARVRAEAARAGQSMHAYIVAAVQSRLDAEDRDYQRILDEMVAQYRPAFDELADK